MNTVKAEHLNDVEKSLGELSHNLVKLTDSHKQLFKVKSVDKELRDSKTFYTYQTKYNDLDVSLVNKSGVWTYGYDLIITNKKKQKFIMSVDEGNADENWGYVREVGYSANGKNIEHDKEAKNELLSVFRDVVSQINQEVEAILSVKTKEKTNVLDSIKELKKKNSTVIAKTPKNK